MEVYLDRWKEYKTYEPAYHNDNEHYIGLPLIILVKGDTILMSRVEEAFEQLRDTKNKQL